MPGTIGAESIALIPVFLTIIGNPPSFSIVTKQ